MTIRDVLIPALNAEFGDEAFGVGAPPNAIASFPAVYADVGDLTMYDDGGEATVVIEHVTHHHVNPYDASLTPEQAAQWIADEVIAFIRDLFADRVVLWSVDRSKGGGGRKRMDAPVTAADLPPGVDAFVWSGPIAAIGDRTGSVDGPAGLYDWLKRRSE